MIQTLKVKFFTNENLRNRNHIHMDIYKNLFVIFVRAIFLKNGPLDCAFTQAQVNSNGS
jgi:hypothetical protein